MDTFLTGALIAVVAGIFALGGARYTHNREHERWLRQQRLEAYGALLTASTELVGRTTATSESEDIALGPESVAEDIWLEDDVHEPSGPLNNCLARVRLLGPDNVALLGRALRHATLTQHHAAIDHEKATLMLAQMDSHGTPVEIDRQALEAALHRQDEPGSHRWDDIHDNPGRLLALTALVRTDVEGQFIEAARQALR